MTGQTAFDLVIFDCDGVLVDSEVLACRAVAAALVAIGHAITPDEVGERFLGMSNKDMYAALERERGAPLPEALAVELHRMETLLFERDLCAMPGLEAMLADLALPRCVASSSTPSLLRRKLDCTRLSHWFGEAVFSSAEVARGKPAPDLFLYAASRMGVAPARAVVIEDSAPGILAANSAGMTAFGFSGGSHCRPGYAQRLADAGADLVFQEMSALPVLLAGRLR